MTQDELKAAVARAALAYVQPGSVVGVGTGSTVDLFIDVLAGMKDRIAGAVSSSERSSERLRGHGIEVLDSNTLTTLPVYIDGADEIDFDGNMIKGGGAALTREKIVADIAERFVCIADISKQVRTLGAFPVPVEVIPMASAQVVRRCLRIGGQAVVREGVCTDNGNLVIDVHGLQISDPRTLESEINQWPGVVTVGIFARRRADVCLLGTPEGVKTFNY